MRCERPSVPSTQKQNGHECDVSSVSDWQHESNQFCLYIISIIYLSMLMLFKGSGWPCNSYVHDKPKTNHELIPEQVLS